MTILLIVGLNALAVAGVAALVITSRRRKNGV
jgi:LPXTG-motif cell wall-anchored protein